MQRRSKCLGNARRIRVRMPLGYSRLAWDCRPFGFGRIVAPVADGEIEVAAGVYLDLSTGALRSDTAAQRHSA